MFRKIISLTLFCCFSALGAIVNQPVSAENLVNLKTTPTGEKSMQLAAKNKTDEEIVADALARIAAEAAAGTQSTTTAATADQPTQPVTGTQTISADPTAGGTQSAAPATTADQPTQPVTGAQAISVDPAAGGTQSAAPATTADQPTQPVTGAQTISAGPAAAGSETATAAATAGQADVSTAPAATCDVSLAPSEISSRYTLGPNDVIEVSVMRHPEVSGEYMINQEGNIQYEFVGDVHISGLVKDEAEKAIAKSLEEYIIQPDVSVKISGYNSKIVYVVGEVGSPGKIYMRGDTITVREALVQAGLPQLTGVTRKSRLITPSENGKPDIRKVDVFALLYEGDLRENFEMKPGDVIYIPATFLTKAMRAIQPVANPIGTAAGTGRTVLSPL